MIGGDQVKQRTKYILQGVFIATMLCWVLVSTARAGQWKLFWLNIGAFAFAALVGTLGTLFRSKNRKLILKNMTKEEKASLSLIGQQTGKRLGIRVMPIAFSVPFLGMLFGVSSLIYTLPPAVIVLFILCRPVWKTSRKMINDHLLSTQFAKDNGIDTLTKKIQSP